MSASILAYKVPELECYICGSKDIHLLCHHCKRAMCAEHGQNHSPKGNILRRSTNVEFSELDLHEFLKRENGVHCHYCNHYVTSIEWTRIFAVGAIVCLIFAVLTPSLTLASRSFIGFVIFSFLFIQKWRKRFQHRQYEYHQHKPPLPIFGQFVSIKAREGIEGRIVLNEDKEYSSLIEQGSPRGIIEVTSSFNENDFERFKKYQKKYQLPHEDDVIFNCGYIVLRGKANFYKNESYTKLINPIEITGRINEKDFLEEHVNQQWPTWNNKITYTFGIPGGFVDGLPIQIVPSLMSESKDWSLQFFLQTNSTLTEQNLTYPRVTSFKLNVLKNLEGIENCKPFGEVEQILTNEGEWNLQILWENIDLDPATPEEHGSSVHKENVSEPDRKYYNKYFYIRFENSENIEPDMIVKGEIEVLFDGTLSGLKGAEFFSPLGRLEKKSKKAFLSNFKVKIHFEFNLKDLKLYRIVTKTQWVKKARAIPEPEAITRLVKVLSENEFYAQRVVENLPGSNQADARIVKRLWTINGHYYQKKQPINFRIVAKGIEQYDKSDEPFDGRTDFFIIVRGVISDRSMENNLADVQSKIVKLVKREPELTVEWIDKDFTLGKWEEFNFKLASVGEVPIGGIYYSVTGPSVKCEEKTPSTRELPEEGGLLTCSIKVYFGEGGEVPIILQVVCEDEYGKFAPRKWRKIVKVGNSFSVGRQNYINKSRLSPSKFQ